MPALIGILGGTFDPPHDGHVAAAVAAQAQLGLEQVLIVPAGQAPLRAASPVAPAAERAAMCRLAFAGFPWAVVDEREVRRAGTSWSVETARELATEFPDAARVWIIGADQLARLDRWVRAHAVDRFGPVLVVERALVCELAFDAVQRSTRHKSGVALRFPRIERIRWDKPAAEADHVETLAALAAAGGG